MGRLQLFDDNGDSPNDDVSKIEIDHKFAKRFEHNKKREDLHRYEEELKKRGRGDDGSDSEDSSEDDLDVDLSKDIPQILDGIIKLKNNHSILKNKDAKLFPSDSESDESDTYLGDDNTLEEGKDKEVMEEYWKNIKYNKKDEKTKKPMYLKDVISKQLLENGPESDDEEIEDDDINTTGNMVKSYSEEQEELRREFLKAAEKEGVNDEEGDLLREKNSEKSEEEDEGGDIEDKLDKILGDDDTLEDKDKEFLKDFWKNKRYIMKDKKTKDLVDDDIQLLSEDEELVEKQEDFERSYNFRYEENAGDRIMGYSRKVEGSVRKKDNARKSQRERKEERIAQAEFERKEELKRLKNLKKKEINEKLEKIREVAGFKDSNDLLNEDDLEKEFDPNEYDQKMNKAFGDEYYKADDVSPEFGSDEDEDEKPDFGKEDDLLGLPKGWDEVEEPAENGDEEPAEKGDEEPVEGKRKRKRKPSNMEKALRDELMEDYYKLDYEGTVGDLKTRFKYKQVESKKFGLSPFHILMSDDKDLNEYVPLKKLATYQDKEWEVPRKKTKQLKEKIKEEAIKVVGEAPGETSNSTINKRKKIQNDSKEATSVAGEASDSGRKIKKKKTNDDGKGATEVVKAVPSEGSQSTESNDQKNTLSRKSRRKQNQRELKLSEARKMSYEVKSTNKNKNKNKK